MPEEVLFEAERRQDRAAIADYLRTVADRLDDGQPITLGAGDRSVTVEPSARPTFEVKVERETARGESAGELSVEFEIEWDETDEGADEETADATLRVE